MLVADEQRFVQEQMGTILRTVRRMARRWRSIDPDDLTQEVLLQLLSSKKLGMIRNLDSFLRTAVRNKALTMIRKETAKKRTAHQQVSIDASGSWYEGSSDKQIPIPSHQLEEPLDYKLFEQILGSLPKPMSQALLLQIEGYTLKEIAEMTATNIKSVGTNIYRGKLRVQRELERRNYFQTARLPVSDRTQNG